MKIKLHEEKYSPSIKASEHCSSRVAKSYQLLEILDLILVQCRKKYLFSCGRSSATKLSMIFKMMNHEQLDC